MECPKCGFIQPASLECISCGIMIERFRPEDERPSQQQSQAPAGMAPSQFKTVAEDPFGKPIRNSLRIARTGAGVVGLALGAWLFLAGQNLDLAPHHVLFLIGYGCISLFWVLSAILTISVRQFAVEMLIFVISTLLLRVALPEAFDPGTLSNRHSTALNAGLGDIAQSQGISGAVFVARVEQLVDDARTVLDDSTNQENAREWLDHADILRKQFREMESPERKKIEVLYKGLVALETHLKEALSDDAPLDAFEKVFVSLESLESLIFTLQ
jgi:hypothetical protein